MGKYSNEIIENFSLDGWTLFSDRRNSKNYVNADKTWMLKLDAECVKRPLEEVIKDHNTLLSAIESGVKTPKVGDVVRLEDGTIGVLYQYIENKTSIARAMSNDLSKFDEYVEKFAKATKDFHSKDADKTKLPSVIDVVKEELSKCFFANEEQKEKIMNLATSLMDTDKCLHGDLQTSNFIMTGDDLYAIDLDTLCYGNPLFDIEFFRFFCFYMPDDAYENVLHLPRKKAEEMFELFIRYYNDCDEKKIKKMNEDVRKYIILGTMVCFKNGGINEHSPHMFERAYKESFGE